MALDLEREQQRQEQQFLVRLLNGSTRCMRFGALRVSCEEIKARVFEIDGIPPEVQRIVTGTRDIQDGEVLESCGDGYLAVLLRLRGGKGGFGSLLRGAATKAGQKKTSNYDACRDMSGRRLRHVNAEKKLKEWNEEAGLRQLEVVAQEYLKKESQRRKNESTEVEDLKKFREQAERKTAEVQEAVLDGLKRAKRDGKRKQADTEVTVSKRFKLDKKAQAVADKLMRFEEQLLADSDDSDDDDLDDVVEDAGASSSSGHSVLTETEEIGNGVEIILPSETVQVESLEEVKVQPEVEMQPVEEPSKDDVVQHVEEPVAEVTHPTKDTAPEPVKAAPETTELKLDDYQNVQEFEALGLERLKLELQKRGLKCGGSLSERAARLFLLKSTPIEKLDKKHFAKSK